MDLQQKTSIVLASASPRRQDLLHAAGLNFSVIIPRVVEQREDNELPENYATRNSKLKCQWVCRHLPSSLNGVPTLVISADTIVVMGERVLEKPVDESDARSMLRELSGKTHQVMTGFTVASVNTTVLQNVTRLIKTDVEFKELSEAEISRYVATGEPMDKAGAYAAQGVAGYLIRRIVGSYTNVIGLPVAELIDELKLNFSDQWSD